EYLLLTRDFGGIAILFVMPLVLIITITLIQDSTFNTINDVKIPILLVDNDNGNVSENIKKGLETSNAFEIIIKGTEDDAKNLVFTGTYQLAIIIPAELSSDLERKVNHNVEAIISKFTLDDAEENIEGITISTKEIKLY